MGALASSIASSVLTNATNVALTERQRYLNERYQDRMNKYNLPVNQIQRLKDAGINPNSLSMSEGMNVQGNTSVPINPYTTPQLQDPMSIASNSYLSMQQGTTEEQLRGVRKEQALADIENLKANAAKLGVDTQYQSIINTFAASREAAAIQGQKFQNRLTLWQTAQVKQEARKLSKYIDEVMPEEIKKLVAEQEVTVGQLDLIVAQIANLGADTELKESQKDVADTQAGLNVEQRGLLAQESSNYQALTDKILAQYQATINKIAAEADLTEQQAFYYLYELAKKYGIRVFGVPIIGHGGVNDVTSTKEIQKQAADKYGN